MNKEELIDKMVTAVMEDFDFDRVHRVMVNLDWKWDIGDGETLTLQFILTEMTSYASDFINIDEPAPPQKADIKAKRIEDCNLSVRTTNICKADGIEPGKIKVKTYKDD